MSSSIVPDGEELCHLSATELLSKYRVGDTTPNEVLEQHFARIDRTRDGTGGQINAFTEELRDQARAAALAATARYSSGESGLPALLGIPIVAKEKHAIAGRTVTQGIGREFGVVAETDLPIIRRIQDAGAILHARTTTPEFSCAGVTHSVEWGVTRNPWNLTASPGGSSGGSGAALAAGYTTLATASDIGGSTRMPASFSGVVGYKAPYGRIPGSPPLAADWYRGDGPMARSVSDVALLHSVMAGRDPSDHASWGERDTDYSHYLKFDPHKALHGLRIAYSPTLGGHPVADAVRVNSDNVAALLRAAGATVDEVEPKWNLEQIEDAAQTHFGLIFGQAMLAQVGGDTSRLSPYTQEFARRALDYEGQNTVVESLMKDAAIQGELAETMNGYDALLTPTIAVEMFEADANYIDGMTVGERHLRHYMNGAITLPFNIANRCPVMSVPTGVSSVGVPTGIQVVGHPFDEGTVFQLSATIEELLPSVSYPEL